MNSLYPIHRPVLTGSTRVDYPSVQRSGVAIAGVVATVVLHLLLLAPMLFGGPPPKRHLPDTQGAAASRTSSDQQQSMTVVFIDESSITDLSEASDEKTVRALTPIAAVLPTTAPEVLVPAVVDDSADTDQPVLPEANGDEAGHSLMFGRYMEQISSRIQRAWLRPRTSTGVRSFACKVQIVQDRSGFVQEVTLQECNGDARWQMSLVRAIQSASPLPAPPEPAVFSNLLTLEFQSDPYGPGTSADGFEPAPRTDAAPASTSPLVTEPVRRMSLR
jgi:hypothetical protein